MARHTPLRRIRWETPRDAECLTAARRRPRGARAALPCGTRWPMIRRFVGWFRGAAKGATTGSEDGMGGAIALARKRGSTAKSDGCRRDRVIGLRAEVA